jgi:sulfatase modifying factor 1
VFEPFAPRRGRWSPLAVALLAIAACGSRYSGSSAGTGSSTGTGAANGSSSGTIPVGSSGPSSGGSSGVASVSVSTGTVSGGTSGTIYVSTSGATSGRVASGCVVSASGSGASTVASAGASTGSNGSGSSGASALPLSCQPGGPGMTNCGACSENCCTSLEVTGGTYYRTYDGVDMPAGVATLSADGGPTGEADLATVSTFQLDKYLVTVGRFRQFVNAVQPPDGGPGWLPAAGSGKHTHLNGGLGLANSASPGAYEPGWAVSDDGNIAPTNANLACVSPYAAWTNTAGSQENLPINCVNWSESYAFCIWDGGFLPSEGEWEYTAAGGSQQREYPWGSADPGTENEYAIYGLAIARNPARCYYPSGELAFCMGAANIAPVGTATLGAGLWGQLDLAGDVLEWNLDWYANYEPCTDCAHLTATSVRVVRGGYYDSNASWLVAPYRFLGFAPTSRSVVGGLRCARSP